MSRWMSRVHNEIIEGAGFELYEYKYAYDLCAGDYGFTIEKDRDFVKQLWELVESFDAEEEGIFRVEADYPTEEITQEKIEAYVHDAENVEGMLEYLARELSEEYEEV